MHMRPRHGGAAIKPDDLYIRSLGVYLPPGRMSLSKARKAGLCGEEYRGSDLVGVAVAEDVMAPADMAVIAARQALRRLDGHVSHVDLHIFSETMHSGPEGWAAAGYILRELGLGETTAFEFYQGCNGILAALEMAAGALALLPRGANALLSTGVNGRDPRFVRWQSAGGGIAIGDGGGAIVLGGIDGIARIDAINSMTITHLEGAHRGDLPVQSGMPRHQLDVTARVKEFQQRTRLRSIDLQGFLTKAYLDISQRSLDEVGIKAKDLARVIYPHTGRDLILASIMYPLGLPLETATWDFGRTVGHLGSADFVASLDHLITTGEVEAGDHVLLVGGTAGFNVATAVVTITGTARQARDSKQIFA